MPLLKLFRRLFLQIYLIDNRYGAIISQNSPGSPEFHIKYTKPYMKNILCPCELNFSSFVAYITGLGSQDLADSSFGAKVELCRTDPWAQGRASSVTLCRGHLLVSLSSFMILLLPLILVKSLTNSIIRLNTLLQNILEHQR